jgi:uncharacterized membrane protein YoaK (UPF0700 family)
MVNFLKWCGDEITRDTLVGYILLFLICILAIGAVFAFMFIVAITALGIWQPLALITAGVVLFIYSEYAKSKKN